MNKKLNFFIFVSLSIFILLSLLTITWQDYSYQKDLTKYQLPSGYIVRYQTFYSNEFDTLIESMQKKSIDSALFKEMTIPTTPMWRSRDHQGKQLVLYEFELRNPPKSETWALVPVVISHTKFWAYSNGSLIKEMIDWDNDKYIVILPVNHQPNRNKIKIQILATLDASAMGLGSLFGTYYGPYTLFPRLSHQYFSVVFYDRTVMLVGGFLTLLIVLLNLLLNSHRNSIHLALYSFFFNFLALFPTSFPNINWIVEWDYFSSIVHGVGLGFLLIHVCDLYRFSLGRWKYLIHLSIIALSIFSRAFFDYPDFFDSGFRIILVLSLFLIATFSLNIRKDSYSAEQRINHKLLQLIFLLIFLIESMEYFFLLDIFYARFHTIHLFLTVFFLYLSFRAFKTNEQKLKQLIEVEAKAKILKLSLGMLKHDISTPFAKVGALLKMVSLVDEKDTGKQIQLIKNFQKNFSKEKKYIDSLIEDTNEILNEDSFDLEKFALSEALDSNLLTEQTDKYPDSLKIELEVDEFTVVANKTRLLRVVRNLVKNAITATKGDTHIRISTQDRNDNVVIIVHNSNSKIPSHLIDQIFEPYVTTKPGSMGLGLFICKSIVEKMDGRIQVKNLEEGVEFQIVLRKAR